MIKNITLVLQAEKYVKILFGHLLLEKSLKVSPFSFCVMLELESIFFAK
jgi:hypothetical protein